MFKSVNEIRNFQRQMCPSSENLIFYYLNTIYQNLLMREECPKQDINEFNNKNTFSNTMKQKANEKGISFKNFLQYFDIQEFMCERIFKFLDKSKSGKLTKNEFVNGVHTIFFGSIRELYKMAFFICDFNENNKIHKFNMKLILSYIPVKTYEEQQEYIKHINSIINNYFTNLDKKYPEENIRIEKEITFDLYEESIEEYINDESKKDDNNFNNNGAFLLFINLISYIFNNHPFLLDNMNYCKFIKNKFLMKVPQIRNRQPNSERALNKLDKDSTIFDSINTQKDKRKNNSKEKKLGFSNTLKNPNFKNDPKALKNLYEDELNIISGKEEKQTSGKNMLLANTMKNIHPSDENSYHISQTFKNTLKPKKSNAPVKLSPPKQESSKVSSNYDSIKDDLLLVEGDETDNKKGEEFSETLFKYCEEDNSKFLKKYYASVHGKEILFFSSKVKNELCSIWTISKTIIIIGDKTPVSKYLYYPIKFINYNGSFCIIYFEEKEAQKNFAKKCEEFTNFLKIEDLFDLKEKIGEGHFGIVKKCIEKQTGKEYAVKIMNKNKIKDKDYDLVIQERNYLSLVKHPNIVSLIKDFEDENNLYFIMEYYKGGDLSKYLAKVKDNKEKNLERIAGKIIKIIAQGIEYLNQFGIVHRDLKPENIVFGKEDDIKSIKIIDLGVAITLPYGKESSDPIGTLHYISPEMFTHKPYSYKVDVWSIGILLYYLVTGGALPFDDEKMDEEIMGKKVVFTHQEYPEKYFGDKSKSLISLIDKTLEKNPEKRITIHNFLNEEWVNKYSK